MEVNIMAINIMEVNIIQKKNKKNLDESSPKDQNLVLGYSI